MESSADHIIDNISDLIQELDIKKIITSGEEIKELDNCIERNEAYLKDLYFNHEAEFKKECQSLVIYFAVFMKKIFGGTFELESEKDPISDLKNLVHYYPYTGWDGSMLVQENFLHTLIWKRIIEGENELLYATYESNMQLFYDRIEEL